MEQKKDDILGINEAVGIAFAGMMITFMSKAVELAPDGLSNAVASTQPFVSARPVLQAMLKASPAMLACLDALFIEIARMTPEQRERIMYAIAATNLDVILESLDGAVGIMVKKNEQEPESKPAPVIPIFKGNGTLN